MKTNLMILRIFALCCVANTAFAASTSKENLAIFYANMGQHFNQEKDLDFALKAFNTSLYYNFKNKIALEHSIRLLIAKSSCLLNESQQEEETFVVEKRYSSPLCYIDDIEPAKYLVKTALEEYPEDRDFIVLKQCLEQYLPEGMQYRDGFIEDEEMDILENIFSRGKWGIRRTGSKTGFNIDAADNIEFEKMVAKILLRAKEAKLLPEGKSKFEYVVAHYPNGGYFPMHKDKKDRVNDFVMAISIGGPCDLVLAHDRTRKVLRKHIHSKSVYTMTKNMHDNYEHGINNIKESRYVLLFNLPSKSCKNEQFDLETNKFFTLE